LEQKEKNISFTNQLGCVYLDLPLTTTDPIARIAAIKEMTAKAYSSPEPLVSYFLMNYLVGLLPPFLCRLVFRTAGFKVSMSMSNLPGPSTALHFSGNLITKFLFFVPPSSTLGHFVSILSYNGKVMFGMSSDSRLIPDPEVILQAFRTEVENLVLLKT